MKLRFIFVVSCICASTVAAQSLSDSLFLTKVQKSSFDFFWNEANPSTGLIKDRSTSGSPCSIAATGFGLTSIGIGIDNGWITRAAGRDRVMVTLKTFWNAPQGTGSTGVIGYKGFFYHFLKMETGEREWVSELSSIDTALLLAGILHAKQYFSGIDSTETNIRALADSIYYRVDWDWMRNGQSSLTMGWQPESGFLSARWIGYNEGMIAYILAFGSPTHSIPASAWNAWTNGYNWNTYYGYSYVVFPPLFGHQYSHCWIDFRNIMDYYMRNGGVTYFENSRRATLANRAYCIANPKGFTGYGENVWGLTASDDPDGYAAHGAPPAQSDNGTISPTAAGGSIPFAPQECIGALRYMYDTYPNVWGTYGFKDAFNLTRNWYDTDFLGIDQGPFVLMIENYRTQSVWNAFMKNKDIQNGLTKAGFLPVTSVPASAFVPPSEFALEQNYPNPFNPATSITFKLTASAHTTLRIVNALGQEVALLVNETREPGVHHVTFNAKDCASGLYFAMLHSGSQTAVRKMLLLR